MEQATGWTIALAVVLLVTAVVFVLWLVRSHSAAEEVRGSRMRRLADELDMRYFGDAGTEVFGRLPPCSLFEKSPVREVRNLIGERSSRPERLMFDCTFHRPRSSPDVGLPTPTYLVALARAPVGCSARFRLYREDWFGGPVGVRGLYRLSFEDDPSFRSRYLIAGGPAERVRSWLTPATREAIKSWDRSGPRPVIELVAGWVAVYLESDLQDTHLVRRGGRLMHY
ncbi:MAG: hypothetical protein PVJ27_08440, partial [Candidatus Brocadiaceae bacterium]